MNISHSSQSIFSDSRRKFKIIESPKFLHFFKWWNVYWLLICVISVVIAKQWLEGLYDSADKKSIFEFSNIVVTCQGIYLVHISALALFFSNVLLKVVPLDKMSEAIEDEIKKRPVANEGEQALYDDFKSKSIQDYNELQECCNNLTRPTHRRIYATQLVLIYLTVFAVSLDLVLYHYSETWRALRTVVILGLNVSALSFFPFHCFLVYLQHSIKKDINKCSYEKHILQKLEQFIADFNNKTNMEVKINKFLDILN